MENIGICGWKGSGKSRAATILAKNGYSVKKFATPLKNIVGRSFQIFDVEDKLQEVNMDFGVSSKAKLVVHNIFVELGMTYQAASDRIEMESMSNTPYNKVGGRTPNQMVCDVAEMLLRLQLEGLKRPILLRDLLQRLGTEVMRGWDEDIHVNMLESELLKEKGAFVVDDARFPNELALLRKFGANLFWLERAMLTPNDSHSSETSISNLDCDVTVKSREGVLLDESVNHFISHGDWREQDVMVK